MELLDKINTLNPIRGGLLWSGVEAYANEIKFGTVLVHYIINNLVKKIGLSRDNLREESNFEDQSSIKIIFATFLFCLGGAASIFLMSLLDEELFAGSFFFFLTGIFGVITGGNVITKLNNFPITLSSAGTNLLPQLGNVLLTSNEA